MDNESALNFIAGESAGMSGADSDLASWMLMSGDLLGSSGMGLGDASDHFMDSLLPGNPPGISSMNSMAPLGVDALPVSAPAPPAPTPRSSRRTRRTAPQVNSSNTATANMTHDFTAHPQPILTGQMVTPLPIQTQMGPNSGPAGMPSSTTSASSSGVKRKLDRASSVPSVSSSTVSATNSGKPADPSQKRQRRLEKNREIARNCRRRKREKYQKLEEEVERLRQWNKQLETQLNQGKDGSAKEAARKQEMTRMRKHVDRSGSVDELKSMLKQYKELYSDFGRERNAAITYHLSKLKSLLIPTTVSKMTMWSLQQNDEFYDEKKNQKTFGGGIWNMLCSELELSDDQKRTLMSMRGGIRQQRRNIAECLRILTELDNRVKSNFESNANQMDQVMESITPSQQAKFLLWIERNQACTFMLNNMWNKAADDDPTAYPGTDEEFADSASTMGLSDDANSATTPRADNSKSAASRVSSSSSTTSSSIHVKDEDSK
mmetsp:Transcript_6619/g.13406  ORF Transcript_6619/g.13406 Transcript_6619/m.13406 type:complete len:491 (-) Transcript_6619:123-1595(-)